MSPIPGEPLERNDPEFVTKDGRKAKLKLPGGFPDLIKPGRTEQRGEAEPPRDDPRPPINPDHVFGG
jgi:hypothetical protein